MGYRAINQGRSQIDAHLLAPLPQDVAVAKFADCEEVWDKATPI
jgi:hypothetical protein